MLYGNMIEQGKVFSNGQNMSKQKCIIDKKRRL